jgi:phenylalanine ammonia-lyase
MTAGSFADAHEKMLSSPDTTAYLGTASKRMFEFVRQKLGVALHRGLVDHPSPTKGQKWTAGRNLQALKSQ